MELLFLIILILLAVLLLALQAVIIRRTSPENAGSRLEGLLTRNESVLREEMGRNRTEGTQSLTLVSSSIRDQLTKTSDTSQQQAARQFSQMAEHGRLLRIELQGTLQTVGDSLRAQAELGGKLQHDQLRLLATELTSLRNSTDEKLANLPPTPATNSISFDR